MSLKLAKVQDPGRRHRALAEPDPKMWICILRYVFSKFPAKSPHFVIISSPSVGVSE